MRNILVVDDHPAIRMAVSIMLTHEGYYLCGEVDNGVEAIHTFKKLLPDIVILDIGIPKLDGIEVIKRIKAIKPESSVIILSAQDNQHNMIRCFQAGADGFVSKMDDLTLLKKAIKKCMQGGRHFPREIILDGKYSLPVDDKNIISELSDREMRVFLELCNGKTNKDIARDMLLSEKTISTYKTRIMQKLQVRNIVELVELAKRHMVF
ncbi:response regulator [Aeromonas sp. 604176]|uniref:response regulator n=1 Tax=Aeromonas sp. 604176 TaxID=2712052 RepID=UPI003B9FA971